MKLILFLSTFLIFGCKSKNLNESNFQKYEEQFNNAVDYLNLNLIDLEEIVNLIDNNTNIQGVSRHNISLLNPFIGNKFQYSFEQVNPPLFLDIEVIESENEENILKDILLNKTFLSDENNFKARSNGKKISIDSLHNFTNTSTIYNMFSSLKRLNVEMIGREVSFPEGIVFEIENKFHLIFSKSDIKEYITKYSIIKKIKNNWYLYYDVNHH